MLTYVVVLLVSVSSHRRNMNHRDRFRFCVSKVPDANVPLKANHVDYRFSLFFSCLAVPAPDTRMPILSCSILRIYFYAPYPICELSLGTSCKTFPLNEFAECCIREPVAFRLPSCTFSFSCMPRRPPCCLLSFFRGDFMVSPRGCGGALLYVVVTDFPGHPSEGIDEWVVKVPMKTGLMASCKTNNYLLNALTAMESQVTARYRCAHVRIFLLAGGGIQPSKNLCRGSI